MREVLIPVAKSLRDEVRRAVLRGDPLVVQIDLHHCPFCKVVREHYLAPLVRDRGLPVVQLPMMGQAAVSDFDGRRTTHRELVAGWGVKLAPTVMFFGADGRELAERLVGASIPDFYGAYLDDRLLIARAALRKKP